MAYTISKYMAVLSAIDRDGYLEQASRLRYVTRTPEVESQLQHIADELDMTVKELLEKAPSSFPD
ncbi:MAG TPA: hypothetical protein VGE35_02010 [Candidatus Paceibacterota bacterium]